MKFAATSCALIVAVFLAGFGWSGLVQADPLSFKVALSGAREIPPVETPATGAADITYDPATRVVTWVVTYSALSGPATAAHFHGPAGQEGKAPLMVWMSKQGSPAENPIRGQATLTPEQAQQLPPANGMSTYIPRPIRAAKSEARWFPRKADCKRAAALRPNYINPLCA
jgi:hypothetical protein